MSKLDNYPIPKTEHLFAVLGGGEQYSKLDLSQAYQQLELDEDSKKYTTINTHEGLSSIIVYLLELRLHRVYFKELLKIFSKEFLVLSFV